MQTGFSKGSNSISTNKKQEQKKHHTYNYFLLSIASLSRVDICQFSCACDERCFCSFSHSKFHINYARKLDHYASDRHPWHLEENYAQVFFFLFNFIIHNNNFYAGVPRPPVPLLYSYHQQVTLANNKKAYRSSKHNILRKKFPKCKQEKQACCWKHSGWNSFLGKL